MEKFSIVPSPPNNKPNTPPLRLLDLTLETPANNLALEEALLEAVDAGGSPPTLRLWESPTPFVVLGTGQILANEIHECPCREDGVPILRRCTAGGCVLQGPGCLNYTLALPYETFAQLNSLCASYAELLGRLASALQHAGIPAERQGISDLAVGGEKISGNAQRRKRNALLHHGTLLHDIDADALARYLREPEDRPEYRGQRTHGDFVTTVARGPKELRALLIQCFNATDAPATLTPYEQTTTQRLAQEKYSQDAWNRRR